MQLVNSSTVLLDDDPGVEIVWIKDQFAPTPKMSTYLLAFLVADFKLREKSAVNGLQVSKPTQEAVKLKKQAKPILSHGVKKCCQFK
jgi:hypothetical protein